MATREVLAWRRDDESLGHSVARFEEVDDGWVFHGDEVLVGDETLGCWFRVRLDAQWRTREVHVAAFGAGGERVLDLVADDARRWTVDGVHDPRLDGAVDVDVAATPLTNTFPIRRLAHLAVGEEETTPVAWVDVPALGVTLVQQTYRRLPPVDGLDAWEYADPLHGAFRLTVDTDGLVVDYEGFARRIR